MIDFIEINFVVINKTSLEWKMIFEQHDAQITIKFYLKFLQEYFDLTKME